MQKSIICSPIKPYPRPCHPYFHHKGRDTLIVKQREESLILKKMKALIRRLPSDHPKCQSIIEQIGKYDAGYKGEQSLDFFLSFLPEQTFHILHDLRLKQSKYYFQMDILLLTQSFMVILENKHMNGVLHFEQDFAQFIRTRDGEVEAFQNPCLQVDRIHQRLTQWLRQHRCPQLPIYTFVVFSHPQAIIRSATTDRKITQQIIRRESLTPILENLANQHPEEQITQPELKKIIRKLKKHHAVNDSSILGKYQISTDEVLNGVYCENCGHLPMMREHGTWFCPRCRSRNKQAHLPSLKDYAWLFGSEITNKQLRSFLNIQDRTVATRIIQAMHLPYTGTYRNRVYTLGD